MKIKTVIALAAQILPLARVFMREIEEAMPDKGAGADKLKAVLALIESAFDAAAEVGAEWAEVRPYIERWIGVLVTLWNATGVFKKS